MYETGWLSGVHFIQDNTTVPVQKLNAYHSLKDGISPCAFMSVFRLRQFCDEKLQSYSSFDETLKITFWTI